jgi:hypothetical protein
MERLTDLTEAMWTHGHRAQTAKGRPTAPRNARAVRWCADGWYERVTARVPRRLRRAILRAMATQGIWESVLLTPMGRAACHDFLRESGESSTTQAEVTFCRYHVAFANDSAGWPAAQRMLAAGQAAWDEATGCSETKEAHHGNRD